MATATNARTQQKQPGPDDKVAVPINLTGADWHRLETQCAILGGGIKPGPTVAKLIGALVSEFLESREDADRIADEDPRDLEDREGLAYLDPYLFPPRRPHGKKSQAAAE